MKRVSIKVVVLMGLFVFGVLINIYIRLQWSCKTSILSPRSWFGTKSKSSECGALSWPKGETRLGPQVTVTKMYQHYNCMHEKRPAAAQLKMDTAVNMFMDQVRVLPKEQNCPVVQVVRDLPVGHFQAIDFTRGYVLSAFLDLRFTPLPRIAVFLMIPTWHPKLFCQAWCDGMYMTVPGTPTRLEFFKIAEKNCIWQQFLLHCIFPSTCTVRTVSVTSLPCLRPTNHLTVHRRNQHKKPTFFLGICLKIMFSQKEIKDIHKIIRFVESFRHFGGDVIYLYGFSKNKKYKNSEQVENIIRYYEKLGVIKFYDWTVPNDVSSLYVFGQVLQNNDCIYRHKYEAEHLVFVDIDEVLYPVRHDNYVDMIPSHRHPFLVNRINTDYIQQDKAADVNYCIAKAPKPLSTPRQVLTIGVHDFKPFKAVDHGGVIDEDTIIIFHFVNRTCMTSIETNSKQSKLLRKTLTRWEPVIQKRLKEVTANLRRLGIIGMDV